MEEGIGFKVDRFPVATDVKADKVFLDSQPITIHQLNKEKIKHEPLEKQEKETFDYKSFIFETPNTVGGDAKPTAIKKYPILKGKILVTKSSNKNLVVKRSNIKAIDSKSTLESALCEMCSKTFANRKILKAHMKHHDEKTDICDVCSKAFSTKHILKEHILTHTQQKTQCQICLVYVFGLKKHMKYLHGEKMLVTCSNCGVEIKGISRHEKFCKMTEEERAAYKESIKVECEQCEKVLASKFKLVRHIQAAHSKDRQLKCKFCDHKDNRSDNMKTHVKNNHSNSKE